MDYTKETLRLYKQSPSGTEVYNISAKGGLIIVESGPMGKPPHRIMHPQSEKPRVDRLVQALVEKGYAPLEKTFGPWAAAKSADVLRDFRNKRKAAGRKIGGTF